MKTLTLLRHAKSSWDDMAQRDFDRPLNGRGRRAAETVGRHLRTLHDGFDHILASPAVRVVETLEGAARGFGAPLTPEWDMRLYLASVPTLLDAIHAIPAEAANALLVGHNPGMEQLVLTLAGPDGDSALQHAVEEKFPTAAVAVLRLEVEDWAAVGTATGTLDHFIRPRDLDPQLGPDGT